MKIGYFEVHNGCAGDMLAASMVDAGLAPAALRRELAKLGLRNYSLRIETVRRPTGYGHPLKATLFRVLPHKDAWDDSTAYPAIVRLIEKSRLAPAVKDKIKGVFAVLAQAEARVHGEKPDHVHFHEVGQVDAIVETAAVVAGLELLGVDKVYCSAVGIAEPAPATVEMLKGRAVIVRDAPYETATPTGVAILKGLCGEGACGRRAMTFSRVGYGAGTREEPAPNVVNFYLGEQGAEVATVAVIEANVDDMNPLLFEQVMEKLYEAGALDVHLAVGQGKKNRPVFHVTVLAPERLVEEAARIIFEETTTLGLRYRVDNRLTLERSSRNVKTPWGKIPVKIGFLGGKPVNAAPEYEACRSAARKHGVPLKTVYDEVRRRMDSRLPSPDHKHRDSRAGMTNRDTE